MIIAARTHKGLLRDNNEDGFYAPEGVPEGLLLVADGMGGHNAGEVASAVAVREVVAEIQRLLAVSEGAAALDAAPKPPEQMIKSAVRKANQAVLRASADNPAYEGMGTTLTMAVRELHGHFVIGHVGDSRAYHFGRFGVRRLTRDHNLAEELVRMGEITLAEAAVHPQRHYITRGLGIASALRVDITRVELRSGEGLLLCTDGLTIHVSDDEIAAALSLKNSPAQAADFLLKTCLERGARDNVTMIVARCEEADV